jgi:hypothetical protein
MGNPTRFRNGVTNNDSGALANLSVVDSTSICIYQNDFHIYNSGDWTVVAGGGTSSSALSTSIVGGALALTWNTSGVQSNTLKGGAFVFNPATSSAAGSQFWFEAGLVLPSDTSAPSYVIGMVKGAPSSPSDGVYFTKSAAGTWNLVIKAAAGSTTTIDTGVTPTNSARTSLAFYYDGKPTPTLYVYIDGVVRGTVGSTGSYSTTGLSNLPANTIQLNPSFQIGTAAGPLNIDYVTAACEVSGRV